MGEAQRLDKTIYIVDDDAAVRDALGVIFMMEGFEVRSFGRGQDFLAVARHTIPSCVILDVHMPGRSGLDILKDLNADHYPAPIFIISGQGDIPMAVQAIKDGAFDFIEKPFDADTLVERIREAIDALARKNAPRDDMASLLDNHLLTPREREVLHEIAAGASNKEAGRHLGISPRTIEVHRARIMEKMGARNAADLVRIVLTNESGRA